MGRKSYISGNIVLVALLFSSVAIAQAEVVGCSSQIALSTQNINNDSVQKQTPIDIKTGQVKDLKLSKKSSGYLGMFKLLIPDTLR